jgi:hypothetical protein
MPPDTHIRVFTNVSIFQGGNSWTKYVELFYVHCAVGVDSGSVTFNLFLILILT